MPNSLRILSCWLQSEKRIVNYLTSNVHSCLPKLWHISRGIKDETQKITCPSCHKGTITEAIIQYDTKLLGRPITIKDAHVAKCSHCYEIFISGREIKRWYEKYGNEI